MKLFLFLLLCVSIYCLSCTCKGTIYCGNGSLRLITKGFNRTDIDSMLLIAYKPNNNPPQIGSSYSPIDTQIVKITNNFFRNDTCFINYFLDTGNDYKIIFPTSGAIYTFNNLKVGNHTSEEKEYGCGKDVSEFGGCVNELVSFTVNGQIYSASNYNQTIYYMVK